MPNPSDARAVQSRTRICARLIAASGEWVSGQELATEGGVSRNAVWKQIESLRQGGFEIDARPRCGYRLLSLPDSLTPESLLPRLSTHTFGRAYRHLEETDSTNDVLHRWADEGAPEGALVTAEKQTRGRGRRGRTWSSKPGKSLTFSLLLRPAELPLARAAHLTLVSAVACAQGIIRATGLECRTKWPNDLLLGVRKVGGILTETTADSELLHFAVIGVGINANTRHTDFPRSLRDSSTSLSSELDAVVSRADLLSELLLALEEYVGLYYRGGWRAVRDAYLALDETIGRQVLVDAMSATFQGRAEGLDERGQLVVRTADGHRHVLSVGDVTIRW